MPSSSKSTAVYHNTTQPSSSGILTAYLNELNAKLGIPITIEAPYELTPSLLLAILECITRHRLPIPDHVRRARDVQTKIQTMKIFLGVLESDVLREDVGLSEVDPRRLAVGEWEEVVFVGEVLCWLGKTYGYISHAGIEHPKRREDPYEDSTRTSWREDSRVLRRTRSREVSLSPPAHSHVLIGEKSPSMVDLQSPNVTDTTVISEAHETEAQSTIDTPSLSALDLFDAPSRIGVYRTSTPPLSTLTYRVQEDEEPAFTHQDASARVNPLYDADTTENESATCGCPTDVDVEADESPPARRSRWMRSRLIRQGDEETEDHVVLTARQSRPPTHEAQEFVSLSPAHASAPRTPYVALPSSRVVTRHTSPTQYTLALLNERAQLLEELANLRRAASSKQATDRSYTARSDTSPS